MLNKNWTYHPSPLGRRPYYSNGPYSITYSTEVDEFTGKVMLWFEEEGIAVTSSTVDIHAAILECMEYAHKHYKELNK